MSAFIFLMKALFCFVLFFRDFPYIFRDFVVRLCFLFLIFAPSNEYIVCSQMLDLILFRYEKAFDIII